MASKIIKGLVIAALCVGCFFALIFAFQYIWNMTLPAVFGCKEITYLQALGILALSRILFGGFGFRWSNSEKGKFWRERLKMKMTNMSEEERAEFKRRLWQKCNS